MKNIMTEYQRELTTNNLHLVKEVIQKRIKINNLPLLAYEDFYAIGCEAAPPWPISPAGVNLHLWPAGTFTTP